MARHLNLKWNPQGILKSFCEHVSSRKTHQNFYRNWREKNIMQNSMDMVCQLLSFMSGFVIFLGWARPEAVSSIMTKVEIAKYINLQIQSKLLYRLVTDWLVCKLQVRKLVLIDSVHSNGKINSHLQMDIFCHFDFCHNGNSFWWWCGFSEYSI